MIRLSEWYCDEAIARLAAVVILRALEDLSSPHLETAADARAWLLGDGLAWCRGLGLHADLVREYIGERYKANNFLTRSK